MSCENNRKEVVISMEQKHKALHRADKNENTKKVTEIMVFKSCHYWCLEKRGKTAKWCSARA